MIIRRLIFNLIKRNFINKTYINLEIDQITQQIDKLTNEKQNINNTKYGCDDPNCEVHQVGKLLKKISLNKIN